jgi:DNA-binding NtrC family response regulator
MLGSARCALHKKAPLLERNGHCVSQVAALDDLLQALLSEDGPAVVLCERNLPGGSHWHAALELTLSTHSHHCFILVADREDPELWAELVERGGFDLISAPLSEIQLEEAVTAGRFRAIRQREIEQARERNRPKWRR